MHSVRKTEDHNDYYLAVLMAALEPRVFRAFMTMMKELKNKVVLDEVVRMLQAGDFTAAMQIVETHITNFANDVIPFYTLSGQKSAQAVSGLINVAVRFDQTNARAVARMQSNKLRLIQEFTQGQREAIRTVMISGITRGANPLQQAEEFKRLIGLTKTQVEAVSNYRRVLEMNSRDALDPKLRDARFDPTVENALDTGINLTPSQIDRMVDRYAERQLDFRARTIALTEAMRAVNEGNNEMFQQAIDDGHVAEDDLNREWITARDEKVRGSHAPMHGQVRPFGKPFISGNGYHLRYPGDYTAPASEVVRCRCFLVTTLKNEENNNA